MVVPTTCPRTKSAQAHIQIGEYARVISKNTFPITNVDTPIDIAPEFCYAMCVRIKFNKEHGHFLRAALLQFAILKIGYPILIDEHSNKKVTFFIYSKDPIRNANKFLKGRLRRIKKEATRMKQKEDRRIKTEALLRAITTFHQAYAS